MESERVGSSELVSDEVESSALGLESREMGVVDRSREFGSAVWRRMRGGGTSGRRRNNMLRDRDGCGLNVSIRILRPNEDIRPGWVISTFW